MMAGSSSRTVTLSGSMAAPGVPQNPALEVNGDMLLLTWDQVVGATYYIVKKALDPYAVYTDLPDRIYDFDLSDGSVRLFLPAEEADAFFKVVAGN